MKQKSTAAIVGLIAAGGILILGIGIAAGLFVSGAFSPDKKVHEPIEYHEVKGAQQLEGRIREILRKNSVTFVEPKEDK